MDEFIMQILNLENSLAMYSSCTYGGYGGGLVDVAAVPMVWRCLRSELTPPEEAPSSSTRGRQMNRTHKGHTIFIAATRFGQREWKPSVRVIWSENGEGKLNTLDVKAAFKAREEAETAGFTFAKSWIDSGKPQDRLA